MSGNVTVEMKKNTSRTVLAVVLTAALTLGLCLSIGRRLVSGAQGFLSGALLALMAYVLFRVLYPMFSSLLAGKEKDHRLRWSITADTLTLDEDVIPLDSIKQIHVWPNRDALGHRNPGWVVNIETKGKNRVLRSLTEEASAEASGQELRTLVEALGYGHCWVE